MSWQNGWKPTAPGPYRWKFLSLGLLEDHSDEFSECVGTKMVMLVTSSSGAIRRFLRKTSPVQMLWRIDIRIDSFIILEQAPVDNTISYKLSDRVIHVKVVVSGAGILFDSSSSGFKASVRVSKRMSWPYTILEVVWKQVSQQYTFVNLHKSLQLLCRKPKLLHESLQNVHHL